MPNELEELVFKCQKKGGLNRCFLNENSDVKCSYMSEKKTETYLDKKEIPYFSIYFLCNKGNKERQNARTN